MLELGFISQPKHYYTFAATGLKVKERTFSTRLQANEHMYDVIAKQGLTIVKVYDDNHYKTYVCNNGVRFYIQRA